MPSIGGYHPYGLASILTGLGELQPVNPLSPVYRNFGGHCLMSGVIFSKIRLIIRYSVCLGVILFQDEDMPFIEGDDELLGECTQAFLEASQECKDLLSQLGNGLEVNAAVPSRLDFWTPLETDGNCNLDSAFRIIERCRRPNKKFNSEEVIFQVLLDPDCWLNNGSATIGQTSDAIRTLFETLLRRVTSSLEPTDLIRAIIFSEHLDRPISTHLMLIAF
ncbi:uncharacterized protein TNCV_1801751 [Trichonephila clavipes]|nr:uncharacterized protein TNCV_1801751 [Trichonephila clavipes]